MLHRTRSGERADTRRGWFGCCANLAQHQTPTSPPKASEVKVAVGCFDGPDAGSLDKDDDAWVADCLIEEYGPIVRSGAAALLPRTPGGEPTWVFGWSTSG
ncbi:hypothetical protein [Streptomyces sp. bgisy060]|uniref:hypothetical protein n=1 Tax=Streptomyces sp. bgisy060 TaxID=3413775 RepID=UPI003EBA0C57